MFIAAPAAEERKYMSNVTHLPVRSQNEPGTIEALYLDQLLPGAAYNVITERGSVYRVQLDTVNTRRRADSGKVHALVVMDHFKDEASVEAATPIVVGEPWEISPGHKTTPIVKIEPASIRP